MEVQGKTIQSSDAIHDVVSSPPVETVPENMVSIVDLTNSQILDENSTHYRLSIGLAGNLENIDTGGFVNVSYFHIDFFANVEWNCLFDGCDHYYNTIKIEYDSDSMEAIINEVTIIPYFLQNNTIEIIFEATDRWRDVIDQRIEEGSYAIGLKTTLKFAEGLQEPYAGVELWDISEFDLADPSQENSAQIVIPFSFPAMLAALVFVKFVKRTKN